MIQIDSCTKCDSFFRFTCAIVGLQVGDGRKRRWHRYLVLAVWFLIHSIGISISAIQVGMDIQKPRGLLYFTLFARGVILMSTEIFSLIQFFVRHDEIGAILQGHGRRFQDCWVHITCSSFLILKYHRLFAYGGLTVVGRAYFVLLEIFMSSFFIVYNDIVVGLQEIQKNILSRAQNIELYSQNLIDEKWKFRHRIERANRFFAWILAQYHLRILKAAIRAVADLILSRNWYNAITITIEQIVVIIELFEFARKGSSLKRSCQRMEQVFSNQTRRNTVDTEKLREMRLALRFHEDLDTLRNGCYALETGKFVNFLTTSATCVAVVLQFDFEVLRALASLVEAA